MNTAKVIATTVPHIPGISSVGEFIAYCARVSNPGNQLNNETAPKLLKYLAKNSHWSPFEMASLTLEIVTTRDISHQIIRHRSFSFQEFSQRYAAVDVDKFVLAEARLQDNKNRQNSVELDPNDPLTCDWENAQKNLVKQVAEMYDHYLKQGLAKEVVRKILSEGLTPTTLYMSGTVRSWIHYVQLRSANGTQKEHKEVAINCGKAIKEVIPELSEYFDA